MGQGEIEKEKKRIEWREGRKDGHHISEFMLYVERRSARNSFHHEEVAVVELQEKNLRRSFLTAHI